MLARVKVIGLMSGTSADGVDAVLVDWPEGEAARPFRLLAARDTPFEPELQTRIHRLAAGRLEAGEVLAELTELDALLGERLAEAAVGVAEAAGVPLAEIAGVASHGQTIAHHPERRGTLQIGAPAVLAERTGLPTVADFRPRDLAAGGEGAPLAPFFHRAALGDPAEARLVVNLGGMANVTWLPRGGYAEQALAFDVGPANALLDGVVATRSGGRERRDEDGAGARRGRVDETLLAELLDDPFLARPPPKSTGRERYGLAQAEALVERCGSSREAGDALLATLVAFCAEALARAARVHLPGGPPERLLLGGGGVRNPALVEAIRARFPEAAVEPFDAHGVPADAAEAMAFSLLGRNALLGLPNHLPRCTGARRATVLGTLVPAGPGAPVLGPR